MAHQELIDYEDELTKQALEIYEKATIQGKKQRELADEYGLSIGTINNRIQKAREIVYTHLKDVGKKYLADIAQKYNYLWDEAKREWENTRDPQFLATLRGILGDIRKMMGTDEAQEKVNTVNIDKMIMIVNDKEYAQLEAQKQLTNADFDVIDHERPDDETNQS